MKNISRLTGFSFLIVFLLAACGEKQERFNYTLIKSKLDLTGEQASRFDEITKSHTKRAREAYESNSGNQEAARAAVSAIFAAQDAKIKEILDESQYEIYAAEIKIEREGREKHNMTLIRERLNLDSAQTARYDLTNEAFYQTLIDNHDNYHGKPDVYREYYAEIDKSRQEAFRELMTEEQYTKYQDLAEEFSIGKKEAY